MREHRPAGGAAQARVQADIEPAHHFGDRIDAVGDAAQDLRLAPPPVAGEGAQEGAGSVIGAP